MSGSLAPREPDGLNLMFLDCQKGGAPLLNEVEHGRVARNSRPARFIASRHGVGPDHSFTIKRGTPPKRTAMLRISMTYLAKSLTPWLYNLAQL